MQPGLPRDSLALVSTLSIDSNSASAELDAILHRKISQQSRRKIWATSIGIYKTAGQSMQGKVGLAIKMWVGSKVKRRFLVLVVAGVEGFLHMGGPD